MGKTRKSTLYLLLASVIVFGMLFVSRVQVSAATQPANLRQTGSGSSSFTVEWDSSLGNKYHYYRLSESADFSNSTTATRIYSSNNSAYIYGDGIGSGKSYYVEIGSADSTSDLSAIVWSTPIEVVTKTSDVDSKSVVQTGATTTSIAIKWGSVPGANYYEIKYYPTDGKVENAVTTTSTTNSITINGLKKNTEYHIDLYAGRMSSTGYVALQSYATHEYSVPVLPSKITGVENTTFYPFIDVAYFAWDKSNPADKYQYEIYDNSGKKVITGTSSSNTSTRVESSKLKKSQFYKIRVRGYILVDGNKTKYGEWSDWLYFARSPYQSLHLKNSGNNLKVSWGKVTGATGYTVYISTKEKSGYKKVKTLTKTSLTISKYGKSKLKKGTKYYVCVVANKKAKYNSKKSKTFNSYTYYTTYITKT